MTHSAQYERPPPSGISHIEKPPIFVPSTLRQEMVSKDKICRGFCLKFTLIQEYFKIDPNRGGHMLRLQVIWKYLLSLLPIIFCNTLILGQVTPNDPYFQPKQWALRDTGQQGATPGADIKADSAWAISEGDSSVILIILDSGLQIEGGWFVEHDDIRDPNRIIFGPNFFVQDTFHFKGYRNGYSILDTERTINDHMGHGTSVIGIAGAKTNNDTGIAGVGWQCKILVIKIAGKWQHCNPLLGTCDTNYTATDSTVSWGIRYAVDYARNHPDKRVVISLSYGNDSLDTAVEPAVEYAESNNVLIVAAAGNNGTSIDFPAAYSLEHQNVVAVTATTKSDGIASYSSHGNAACIAAPGGEVQTGGTENQAPAPWALQSQMVASFDSNGIWSTWLGNSYAYGAGTSISTPHVAGVAGLLLAVNSNLTTSELRTILESSADDKGSPGWDEYYGWGRLNAYRALLAVLQPKISSPANGANVSISPTVTWGLRYGLSSSSKITSYRLQLSTSANFQNPVRDITGISTTSDSVTCLAYATTYHWRVGAVIVDGSISWSDTGYFNTPSLLGLVSPSNCATVSNSPTLTWDSLVGAISYRVQIDTNSNFTNPIKDTAGITALSMTATGLANTMEYYWRVCPYSCGDSTNWSGSWYFYTSPPIANQLTGSSFWHWWHNGDQWVNSPLLSWSVTGWCNVTYGLYKYTCTQRHGCPDTIGSCIYSGPNTSYADSNWAVGEDSTHTVTYYVKVTAGQTGQSTKSNHVTYSNGIDYSKTGPIVGNSEVAMPKEISLLGNYPNPFNPTTEIRYNLPQDSKVLLKVYNVLGQAVATLVDGIETVGYKSATFDATNIPSGVYFYRIQVGEKFVAVKKMLIIK